MPISVEDVRRSTVKYKYNYRKSTITAQIVSFAILAFCSGFFITLYLSPMKTSIWKTTAYTSEQRMKTIFMLLGILFFIEAIVVLIKIPALKKSFVCVTENGIYGIGGKSFYFSTQSFTIPADQITNISEKGNRIIIESGGNNYPCAVENVSEAINKITLLNNFNGTCSVVNSDYSDFVDCPICGKVNSSKNEYCYNCQAYLHTSDNKLDD